MRFRHACAAVIQCHVVASLLNITDEERSMICNAEYKRKHRRRHLVRWFHVPKTGTSFANTIWHHGCPTLPENASVAHYDHDFEIELNETYPINTWCSHLIDHTPATHKPVGAVEWRKHKGRFVGMFRDPLKRAESAFFYSNQCIQDCNPENTEDYRCDAVRDPTRNGNPGCQNLQSAVCANNYTSSDLVQSCTAKMLLGYPCNADIPADKLDKNAAVGRLREGFSFVGLVEEWNLSICLFHRMFGGPPLPVAFAHVRPTVYRTEPKDCPAPEKQNGAIKTDLDHAIYTEAELVFQSQIDRILARLRRPTSFTDQNVVLHRPSQDSRWLRGANVHVQASGLLEQNRTEGGPYVRHTC